MIKVFGKFGKKQKKAQSLVEYGLILALVAIIAIAALQLLGEKVQDSAKKAGDTIESASNNSAELYCKSIDKTVGEDGLCVDGEATP